MVDRVSNLDTDGKGPINKGKEKRRSSRGVHPTSEGATKENLPKVKRTKGGTVKLFGRYRVLTRIREKGLEYGWGH